jgi:hypothetical protein
LENLGDWGMLNEACLKLMEQARCLYGILAFMGFISTS